MAADSEDHDWAEAGDESQVLLAESMRRVGLGAIRGQSSARQSAQWAAGYSSRVIGKGEESAEGAASSEALAARVLLSLSGCSNSGSAWHTERDADSAADGALSGGTGIHGEIKADLAGEVADSEGGKLQTLSLADSEGGGTAAAAGKRSGVSSRAGEVSSTSTVSSRAGEVSSTSTRGTRIKRASGLGGESNRQEASALMVDKAIKLFGKSLTVRDEAKKSMSRLSLPTVPPVRAAPCHTLAHTHTRTHTHTHTHTRTHLYTQEGSCENLPRMPAQQARALWNYRRKRGQRGDRRLDSAQTRLPIL